MPQAITRVKLPVRIRRVTVQAVSRPTRHVVRVVLAGDDLEGFQSPAADDHVKVFFPAEGQTEPTLPSLGPDGPTVPEGATPPVMRDYTPLRFDAEARTLELELALHGEGVASRWAERAKPGDVLGLGGPKGSTVVDYAGYAGFLLVGDESSLPSITRRLAELPAGTRATVLVSVEGPEDERALTSPAALAVTWLHRGSGAPGDPAPYLAALDELPPAPFFTWLQAGEDVVLAVRQHLVEARGVEPAAMIAKAYWKPAR